MNRQQKEYVKSIYYNPAEAESLGSIDRLFKRIKNEGLHPQIKKKDLELFLRGEETYTSHKQRQRLKHYAKIIAPHPGYSIDLDSALMPFPKKNRLKYMIIGQDAFSRRVGARAVTSLKAVNVNRAVSQIIRELGNHFRFARTDRGTDYFNARVAETFRRLNIKHIPAFEPTKAGLAENMIRIVKRKIYKMLQYKGDHNWSRYLNDVIRGYNRSKNKALFGLSPIEVTPQQVPSIWFKTTHKDLANQPDIRPYLYKIDQNIRIHYSRGQAFRKEYNESTGARVYSIDQRFSPGQNHLYKVRDDRGNILPGRFRENQLEPVHIDADTVWRIEKIVGRRVRGGIRQLKIRWLDHSADYDSWEPADQIRNLRARR